MHNRIGTQIMAFFFGFMCHVIYVDGWNAYNVLCVIQCVLFLILFNMSSSGWVKDKKY